MFGHVNRTSLNLGELAASPMAPTAAAAVGISAAGSLLQSEREAVIGAALVSRQCQALANLKVHERQNETASCERYYGLCPDQT